MESHLSSTAELRRGIACCGHLSVQVAFEVQHDLAFRNLDLEAHTLAGGSPLAFVRAAARLKPTGARVDLRYLAALDLGYGAVAEIVDRFLEIRRQQPDYDFVRAANEYTTEHKLSYRTR